MKSFSRKHHDCGDVPVYGAAYHRAVRVGYYVAHLPQEQWSMNTHEDVDAYRRHCRDLRLPIIIVKRMPDTLFPPAIYQLWMPTVINTSLYNEMKIQKGVNVEGQTRQVVFSLCDRVIPPNRDVAIGMSNFGYIEISNLWIELAELLAFRAFEAVRDFYRRIGIGD